MKIDCFTHVMPTKYTKALEENSTGYGELGALHKLMPELDDLPLRISIMDEQGVDMQALTIGSPPIEVAVESIATGARLAHLANDGIAEMAARYPDRFIPIGNIAMNDMKEGEKETRRCIEELGMKGILIYSSDRRRPIDGPEFQGFYRMMADYDLPIWLHPERQSSVPDYVNEDVSYYAIWQIFGWPFETSAAMARLVFSGLFDRHPNIKFITHHAGAMIPFFEKRIEHVYPLFMKGNAHLRAAVEKLQEPILNYFKKFYNDTAVMGSVGAMTNSYSFFGADHLLFGTDSPFDMHGGRVFMGETIASIDAMLIHQSEKDKMYSGNAIKLLKLDV